MGVVKEVDFGDPLCVMLTWDRLDMDCLNCLDPFEAAQTPMSTGNVALFLNQSVLSQTNLTVSVTVVSLI